MILGSLSSHAFTVSAQIKSDAAVPTIQKGDYVYADMDTAKGLIYVLLKDGLWQYDLTGNTWLQLKEYSKNIETVAGTNLEFKFSHENEKLLLWSLGVGVVYVIDLKGDLLPERVDRSFLHKNQFGHTGFIRKGMIYAFGGYGFWQSKNLITYYKPELKEWKILTVDASSPYPEERSGANGVYMAKEDELYIYGGIYSKNSIHDDGNSISSRLYDIWKFDFKSLSWRKWMDSKEDGYEPYTIRMVRRNSGPNTFYSEKSGIWYIPVRKEGQTEVVTMLKPINLKEKKAFKPIEMNITLQNEFRTSHFFFDSDSEDIVLLGVNNLTNREDIPLSVMRQKEINILHKLVPAENNRDIIYASAIVLGGLVFAGFIYFRIHNGRGSHNSSEKISKDVLLNTFSESEQQLFKALWDADRMLETNELETLVWHDIDNYDYRRKLRNENIRSINEKFQKQFNYKQKLIIREKDKEDNRRYRYGMRKDLIG